MDEEAFKKKFLDQLIRVQTNEGRVIIGKMKCIDNCGNLYLIQTVEVFPKDSDLYSKFNLYENHPDHSFYFNSEKNNYQLYNNCIVPMKEILKLSIIRQ